MSKEPMQSNHEDEGTEESNGESGSSRKVHQFYFVKFWPYKDPEKDSKLEWSRKQCEELDREKKLVVDDKTMELMSRGKSIDSELGRQRYRDAVFASAVEWTEMVVGFLQAAIDKLNVTGSSSSTQPGIQPRRFLMSSVRNELGRAWFWYSQSNNREKYEQILKEVEQIEDRLDVAKAEAAANGNIWNPLSSIKAMEEQIHILNTISEELRPERCEVDTEIESLENKIEALRKEKDDVSKKFQVLINRKSDLCDFVVNARKEEDDANAKYNEYVSLMRNADELARRKDLKALEQLSSNQVDKFMQQWKDNRAFRNTYEKALLWSLHYRELSRDGRIRNDDEEPIIENGEIHEQYIQLISYYLTLFLVLDERNKMQR